MASFGCVARHTDARALLLGVFAACGACTTTPESVSTPAFSAGVELPEGEGREILATECLNCHELAALELFKDFYNRENWRSLVISMRANGAQVNDAEVELLADYLVQHFGTR